MQCGRTNRSGSTQIELSNWSEVVSKLPCEQRIGDTKVLYSLLSWTEITYPGSRGVNRPEISRMGVIDIARLCWEGGEEYFRSIQGHGGDVLSEIQFNGPEQKREFLLLSPQNKYYRPIRHFKMFQRFPTMGQAWVKTCDRGRLHNCHVCCEN